MAVAGAAILRSGGPTSVEAALIDLWSGVWRWRLWALLGWYDLLSRYRRTAFGPMWTTLAMAFFVAALGMLYAELFGRSPAEYIPHLAAGLLAWSLLSGIVVGGCRAFVTAANYITEMPTPLSVFVYRAIWQQLLIFLYQLLVLVAVLLAFEIVPGPAVLLALPALLLVLANAVWLATLLAIAAARFRDLTEIVNSLLRLVFFLTPVIWLPDMVGMRARFIEINPFYHFVELLRGPLLGYEPALRSWVVALALAALGAPLALLVFARARRRIAYWL